MAIVSSTLSLPFKQLTFLRHQSFPMRIFSHLNRERVPLVPRCAGDTTLLKASASGFGSRVPTMEAEASIPAAVKYMQGGSFNQARVLMLYMNIYTFVLEVWSLTCQDKLAGVACPPLACPYLRKPDPTTPLTKHDTTHPQVLPSFGSNFLPNGLENHTELGELNLQRCTPPLSFKVRAWKHKITQTPLSRPFQPQ